MVIKQVPTFEGLHIIELPFSADMRGGFIKTYHHTLFEEADLAFDLKESYYSISHKNVIRGMHFQLPPHDHAKIVTCITGSILDVVVDLRKDQPSYGKFYAIHLDSQNPKALYIPKGFAHGFKALESNTITQYMVSTVYEPTSDQGIHYDSFGMFWGPDAPIASARDEQFVPLEQFNSPF